MVSGYVSPLLPPRPIIRKSMHSARINCYSYGMMCAGLDRIEQFIRPLTRVSRGGARSSMKADIEIPHQRLHLVFRLTFDRWISKHRSLL